MAQSTVPVYLTGKVGSIVYTGNRQGTAVRMLVTPKNLNTPGQQAQRQQFTTAFPLACWQGRSLPGFMFQRSLMLLAGH